MTATSVLRGRSAAFRPWRIALYVVVIGGAVLYALPFAWMLSSSVRTATEISRQPINFLPSVLHWENYTAPWADYPFTSFYRNTAVVTTLSVLGTLFTGSLVAFAFARMRFRGRGFLFVLVLSTMMLPSQVTLIPIYVLWSKLHFVNTLVPLIVPSFFGGEYAFAFSIFLLRQYMLTIPMEIDDAARVDGANWFQIYWRVILPMSAPALGAVAIFNFTSQWNDFLKPLVYLNTQDNFTLPLGLALLNGRFDSEIGQVMAQTALSILPMVIVFFFAQRNYVQGNVVSGVKG